jgi:Sigma-70, region 4
MSAYNADFWEVSAESGYLENLPAERGLWFENGEDREHRYAFNEFFDEVKPFVMELIDAKLTKRQQEVVKLYYVYGKTQEDIATILDLTQSTVSRHLFGTVRGGKKVGGAIPKLQKVIDKNDTPVVDSAFGTLRRKLAAVA